jgi:hypothetical protein
MSEYSLHKKHTFHNGSRWRHPSHIRRDKSNDGTWCHGAKSPTLSTNSYSHLVHHQSLMYAPYCTNSHPVPMCCDAQSSTSRMTSGDVRTGHPMNVVFQTCSSTSSCTVRQRGVAFRPCRTRSSTVESEVESFGFLYNTLFVFVGLVDKKLNYYSVNSSPKSRN